jgi:hypothetical protein
LISLFFIVYLSLAKFGSIFAGFGRLCDAGKHDTCSTLRYADVIDEILEDA